MLTTIVTALLPMISTIGMWWINMYFTDQANKAAATNAFLAFINAHKTDGNISADEHNNYQSQVTELGTPPEKKS